MNETNDHEGVPRPMLISHEVMEDHIRAGRALRWTHSVAERTFMAAKLGDTWFVVFRDADGYQPAPDELATGLEIWREQLDLADRKMAEFAERASRRDESFVDTERGGRTS